MIAVLDLMKLRILASLLGLLLPQATLAAELFLDERFADGELAITTNLKADWLKARGTTTASVQPANGNNSGSKESYLLISPGGSDPLMVGLFSTPTRPDRKLSLGKQTGDQVTLSLEFWFTAKSGKTGQIRVGLYTANGLPVRKGHSTTNLNSHAGYRFDLDQAGGYGRFQKETGQRGGIGRGVDQFEFGTSMGKPAPALGDARHKLVLTLKRASEGIIATASIDGIFLHRGLDTPGKDGPQDVPGIFTEFDEIVVGHDGVVGVAIPNIKIEVGAAELTSNKVAFMSIVVLVLLGFCVIVICVWRKLKQPKAVFPMPTGPRVPSLPPRPAPIAKAEHHPPPPDSQMHRNGSSQEPVKAATAEVRVTCTNKACGQHIVIQKEGGNYDFNCPSCGTRIRNTVAVEPPV